jgi:hypothetical protein
MFIKMAWLAGNLTLLIISLVIFSACVSAAPAGVPPSPTPEEVGTPTSIPSFVLPSVTPTSPPVRSSSATPVPVSPPVIPPSATPALASAPTPVTRQNGMYPGSDAVNEEAPQIVTVTSGLNPDNSLIYDLNVELDRPARIWAEYYPADDESAIIKTPLSEMADSKYHLQLMRLRPETAYKYQVFATSEDVDNSNEATQVSQSSPDSFVTGPLPPGLEGSSFEHISGQQTYDMTLLDFNDEDFSGLVAIDGKGEVVWYYQHDAYIFSAAQDDNYNLVFNQVDGVKQVEIRPDGTMVREVTDTLDNGEICSPLGRWHHETLLQPDGKVYTLGAEIRGVQFGDEIRQQTGDTIEVWDRNEGTVERLVSLFDLLDPKVDRTSASDAYDGIFWIGCNSSETTQDWTHANSLWFGAEGNILMAIRHLNQIISISPDLKSVQWRLGGPGSDFIFPNPKDQFYHLHTAKELPNGNILLFDNGAERPAAEGGEYSRALELDLDFETMEARKVWEYRHSPDLFAECCSSVERLANGNTVMVFGREHTAGDCCQTFTLVEADQEGNPVSVIKIRSPFLYIIYRAYPLDSINGEFTDEE